MPVYFPSCNFTKACPETSEKIKNYLRDRHGVQIMGCCRPGHKTLSPGDSALTVCHTCAAIVRENVPDVSETNVLVFLDRDPDFLFPDLHGEPVFVQDCWRVRKDRTLQDAVRSLLRKLNARPLELEENRGETKFCGTFRYNPILPGNLKLAPNTFLKLEEGLELLPPEEQQKRLEEHCRKLGGARTACYCNACLNGLKQGGARGVHLLELLFGTAEA